VFHCFCSVLQQLRSLVTVNERLKKQESEFRESCRVRFIGNFAVYLVVSSAFGRMTSCIHYVLSVGFCMLEITEGKNASRWWR